MNERFFSLTTPDAFQIFSHMSKHDDKKLKLPKEWHTPKTKRKKHYEKLQVPHTQHPGHQTPSGPKA